MIASRCPQCFKMIVRLTELSMSIRNRDKLNAFAVPPRQQGTMVGSSPGARIWDPEGTCPLVYVGIHTNETLRMVSRFSLRWLIGEVFLSQAECQSCAPPAVYRRSADARPRKKEGR